MKKAIILLLTLLPFIGIAQLKTIAEGPIFDEPENGFAKIVLMKNGNTAFLQITIKDGINVRIYDAQHKQIASTSIEPKYGKLKSSQVEGIYDVAGTITVFISEIDERKPTLYKLRIDGTTGKLLQEETIGALKKLTMGQGYAAAFGGVPIPDFLVRKDPASDNYGVIRYNTFESDNKKRVELIQFGQAGTETNHTYLSSEEGKYKYTQILDFVIIGKDACALLYSYNTASSGGAANELLLATIKNGAVTYQNIGNSIKRRIDDGLLRYNPTTKNLIFITLERMNTETRLGSSVTNYAIQANIIDVQNGTILKSMDLRRSKASLQYRKLFKEDEGFQGMPQQLYVNEDGTYTLVSEEIIQKYHTSNRYGALTNSAPAGSELGCIAVSIYSEDGTEKSSKLIPKRQTFINSSWSQSGYRKTENFYIATRDNSATVLSGGNQYKSFAYLHGKNTPYIFINDVAENEAKAAKGKLTNVKGVGDCEAYVYNLSAPVGSNALLPRTLAFDKEKSKERNLALFSVSDFDRTSGTYATLKLEKGKGVKVVWMQD